MKKIIYVIILACMSVLVGCNDEEVIEVLESEKNGAGQTEYVSVEELKAEDIVEDDPRPFAVYVTGEVNNPGVYEVAQGARVIDAIDIAGGYTDEACDSYLNLASLVADEQMIYVPSWDEAELLYSGTSIATVDMNGSGTFSNGTQAFDSGSNLININTASKEELMTLPGIGESKAEKIIAYREQNGRFSSPEGIMQISGIKDGLYNKIKDRICAK